MSNTVFVWNVKKYFCAILNVTITPLCGNEAQLYFRLVDSLCVVCVAVKRVLVLVWFCYVYCIHVYGSVAQCRVIGDIFPDTQVVW